MSAKPEVNVVQMAMPESGAQKGTKVHFAPGAHPEAVDGNQCEGGLDDDQERQEYSYPDLEELCWLNSQGDDDDDDAQVTGKLGPAAAAAQRAAGNAQAAAKVVGDNRKVGTQRRKPPSAQTTISAAPSSVASGP